MKRKIEDGTTPPFAVRLPRELQERLRQAGGKRGIGEEIRRRLEASFEAESVSPKTRELLDAIVFCCGETDNYYRRDPGIGGWAENAFAFEVLKACLDLLLKTYRPKGEVVSPPDTMASLFFAGEEKPEDIGRFIVRDLMRAREKRADEGKRR